MDTSIADGIQLGLLGGAAIIGAAMIVSQLIAVWGVRKNLGRNFPMNLKKLLKSKALAGLAALALISASIFALSTASDGCKCVDCQCCAGCTDTGSCDCDDCRCCDNCNATSRADVCCPGCVQ